MGRWISVTGLVLVCCLWISVASAKDRYQHYPESQVLHMPQLEKLPPVTPPAEQASAESDPLPLPMPPPLAESVAEEVIVVPPPAAPPPPVKLWEGNIELGLNGSSGNSDTFSFRFASHVERDAKDQIFSADMLYRKSNDDGTETANRLLGEARQEWLLGESNWTYFIHGTVEFDEFKAYDTRVATDMGLGHFFIRNESTELQTRAGAGVSREIGGPDDEYVPEAVAGLTAKHCLSDRQKLSFTSDYYGDWTEISDYRINSQAAWELLLDEAMNLSLKLSIIDRYDATPQGAKHNDIDYGATVLWSF